MTIEERAKIYANNNPHGNPYNWNAHHDAYMDGAAEQKAIDDAEYRKDMAYLATKREELIDKACKWFKKHYREYVLGGDDMIADFRKAIED